MALGINSLIGGPGFALGMAGFLATFAGLTPLSNEPPVA